MQANPSTPPSTAPRAAGRPVRRLLHAGAHSLEGAFRGPPPTRLLRRGLPGHAVRAAAPGHAAHADSAGPVGRPGARPQCGPGICLPAPPDAELRGGRAAARIRRTRHRLPQAWTAALEASIEALRAALDRLRCEPITTDPPAIGTARVGDSDDYYFAPEHSGGLPINPDGRPFTPEDFRDADGRCAPPRRPLRGLPLPARPIRARRRGRARTASSGSSGRSTWPTRRPPGSSSSSTPASTAIRPTIRCATRP